MQSVYVIIETLNGRLGQVLPCESHRVADGLFKQCVRENDPTLTEEDLEEALYEGFFADDNGYEIRLTGPCEIQPDTTHKKV